MEEMTVMNNGAKDMSVKLDTENMEPWEVCQLQILDLQKQLEVSRQEWNDLYGLVMEDMSDKDFSRLLSGESDYSRWFRLLSCAAMKYLVVLTVRETPGEYMPDHVYKAILDAGFTKFKRDSAYTYVGVKYNGKTWYNDGKHEEESTSYYYESMDGSLSLQVYSESLRNGNRGEVYINDKQQAVNFRGVNIVVYDAKDKKVIDSVALDSHVEGQRVFRRK